MERQKRNDLNHNIRNQITAARFGFNKIIKGAKELECHLKTLEEVLKGINGDSNNKDKIKDWILIFKYEKRISDQECQLILELLKTL